MLQSLHVKNLALMEETEVEFGPGLNILTGETGAGKSLLIGGINLALGGKFEKEMLRKGAEAALVELVFSGNSKQVKEKLAEMELEAMDDDCVIISRKMQPGKSVCKINGETVTAKQIKELCQMAHRRGETLSQMAIQWLLADSAVTSVLVGVHSKAQLLENLKALEFAPLTKEEIDRINEISL